MVGWSAQGTNPVLEMVGCRAQGTNPVLKMASWSVLEKPGEPREDWGLLKLREILGGLGRSGEA